jgi:ubiquitin-conjugating enzyme E2 O
MYFVQLDSVTGHELQRPPRLWASQDLQNLVVMRSRGSVAGSIGERVVFKDPIRVTLLGIQPVLYKDQELNFEVPVDVMVIRLSRTSVEVLWQDGIREWVPATELIPHINPDEHECW